MKLDRISIKNFLSCKEIELFLDPRCQILVGINESGKTNILKACHLISDGAKISKRDVRRVLHSEDIPDEAYVRFFFTIEKEDKEAITKELYDKLLFQKDSPIFALPSKHKFKDIVQFINSAIYNANILTARKSFLPLELKGLFSELKGPYEIVEGWYQIKDSLPPDTENEMGLVVNGITFIHASMIGGIPQEHYDAADGDSAINFIESIVLGYLKRKRPKCIFWEYNNKDLLPPKVIIQDFIADPDSCKPLKNLFELADITNITEKLQEALKDDTRGVPYLLDRVKRVATKHIHEIWEEYKHVSIELAQNGPDIDISVKDTENTYEMEKRSDGFKRFVTFLIMISSAVKTKQLQNTLILIDEPDVSLHPSGSKYLRDGLIKISSHDYVVYSTHSIFMIDKDRLDRHNIVKKPEEATFVEKPNPDKLFEEEVIYRGLNFSLSELFKDENFLFEGWRDKRLFEVVMNGKMRSGHAGLKKKLENVGLCRAYGASNVKSVVPYFEAAEKKVLILTDNDDQARHYKGIHEEEKAHGAWLLFNNVHSQCKAKTGEDFIKAKAFVPAIEVIRNVHNSLPALLEADIEVDSDKLGVIKRWLTSNGLNQQDADAEIKALKKFVFEALSPSDVEDTYYKYLSELSKLVDT